MVGLITAGSGFVAVLADLLGLGSSPGLHPYLHARSEATASVDMLRAARNFCASNSIGLNGQLFIAGYSQGGHTCMALHRELETYHSDEFTITASAPMSGPYDMSGTELADILSPRCPPNPYYAAYVMMAYQIGVFTGAGLFEPGGGALLHDHTALVQRQHEQRHDQCRHASLRHVHHSYAGRALLRLPMIRIAALVQALRDNDLYRWTPVAPMHIYLLRWRPGRAAKQRTGRLQQFCLARCGERAID